MVYFIFYVVFGVVFGLIMYQMASILEKHPEWPECTEEFKVAIEKIKANLFSSSVWFVLFWPLYLLYGIIVTYLKRRK